MGRDHGERLARLEGDRDQLRKELDQCGSKLQRLDELERSVAKLCARQQRNAERVQRWSKFALLAGCALALELVQGPWAKFLAGLGKLFARALG